MKLTHFAGLCAAGILAASMANAGVPGAFNVSTIDGSLDSGYSVPVAAQTWNTQFGNANGSLIGGGGGELNALYVANDATNLYLIFTGNLEVNGNALTFFIDTPATSGSNPLPDIDPSKDGFYTSNDGYGLAVMPSGFAPEFGFTVKFFDFPTNGTPDFVFIEANLGEAPPSSFFTPDTPVSTGTSNPAIASFTLNGTNYAMALDNSNTAGVSGGDDVTTDDPLAVSTGFEIAIPLAKLGLAPGDEAKIFAIYSNGSFGGTTFVSNQFLPPYQGAGPTFGNVGNPTGGPPAIYNFGTDYAAATFAIVSPPASATNFDIYN